MTDYEVNVNWHDRGENRPSVLFDVYANGVEYGSIDDEPVKTVVNSNYDVYTYRNPKYDKNGHIIVYTSDLTNTPDTAEYRVTKDTDDYDYYAQRTFDFTMKWKDGAEDRHYYQFCDNDLTLVAKVKDYITNPNSTVTLDEIQVYVDNVVKFIDDNFVLEKENGDSDILIDLSEENHDHTR